MLAQVVARRKYQVEEEGSFCDRCGREVKGHRVVFLLNNSAVGHATNLSFRSTLVVRFNVVKVLEPCKSLQELTFFPVLVSRSLDCT